MPQATALECHNTVQNTEKKQLDTKQHTISNNNSGKDRFLFTISIHASKDLLSNIHLGICFTCIKRIPSLFQPFHQVLRRLAIAFAQHTAGGIVSKILAVPTVLYHSGWIPLTATCEKKHWRHLKTGVMLVSTRTPHHWVQIMQITVSQSWHASIVWCSQGQQFIRQSPTVGQ